MKNTPQVSISCNTSHVPSLSVHYLLHFTCIIKPEEELFFISFGSGAVATRVASDEVRLGAVKTYMKNGLLLVVRQVEGMEGEVAWDQQMTESHGFQNTFSIAIGDV